MPKPFVNPSGLCVCGCGEPVSRLYAPGHQHAPRLDYELMRRLHEEGLSAPQIAERVGCTPRTVTRWRRQEGLTRVIPATAGAPATPERLEQARRLLDDGASYQEVSRTLGMHERTLMRHFPGRGWSKREGGRLGAYVTQMNRQMNRKAA